MVNFGKLLMINFGNHYRVFGQKWINFIQNEIILKMVFLHSCFFFFFLARYCYNFPIIYDFFHLFILMFYLFIYFSFNWEARKAKRTFVFIRMIKRNPMILINELWSFFCTIFVTSSTVSKYWTICLYFTLFNLTYN